MAYATTTPDTGEILKTFGSVPDAEVERAIAAAYAAFLDWRHTSFAERAKPMHAAVIMRRKIDGYAELLTPEMGKLFSAARAEVALSADISNCYAERCWRQRARRSPTLPCAGKRALLRQVKGDLRQRI